MQKFEQAVYQLNSAMMVFDTRGEGNLLRTVQWHVGRGVSLNITCIVSLTQKDGFGEMGGVCVSQCVWKTIIAIENGCIRQRFQTQMRDYVGMVSDNCIAVSGCCCLTVRKWRML